MAELIVTSDLALVSFIMAVLKEAEFLFAVDPAYGVAGAGFVSHGISGYQRIMVLSGTWKRRGSLLGTP